MQYILDIKFHGVRDAGIRGKCPKRLQGWGKGNIPKYILKNTGQNVCV